MSNNIGATINACKQCAPLGASLVYKGIEKCIPLLHGSQGCSTYIRRYLIGHFREPVDIASSSFHEDAVIFGGKNNLIQAINNIIDQYNPLVIGIATTCLSETIGDDPSLFIEDYIEHNKLHPHFVISSTPSYKGTHQDGYINTMIATVDNLCTFTGGKNRNNIKLNIFNNMFTCEDIRFLKDFFYDHNISFTIFPDYSETLDGGIWNEYKLMPEGGTLLSDIKNMPISDFSIEFGDILKNEESPAKILQKKFNVPTISLPMPIGLISTDFFISKIEEITSKKVIEKYVKQRARLLDAYSDGHKYLSGKRVLIYGEDDLVLALTNFALEIGLYPVVVATGRKSLFFEDKIKNLKNKKVKIDVLTDADFDEIESVSKKMDIDMLIGNNKGYKIAREINVPLVRVGFPIHDRFGAQRFRMLGYSGTLELFDRIVNAFIEKKQDSNKYGYLTM